MVSANDNLIKEWIEYCDVTTHHKFADPIRYMNPEEMEERYALNIANTASALRARVIAELAERNGGNKHSIT